MSQADRDLPSYVKPKDVASLKGAKTKSAADKARIYDKLRPGVPIGDSQKAERMERMQFRAENGRVNTRRQTFASSVTIPDCPSAWCECGKLGHDGDCQ